MQVQPETKKFLLLNSFRPTNQDRGVVSIVLLSDLKYESERLMQMQGRYGEGEISKKSTECEFSHTYLHAL
jgi:hypothetical protein